MAVITVTTIPPAVAGAIPLGALRVISDTAMGVLVVHRRASAPWRTDVVRRIDGGTSGGQRGRAICAQGERRQAGAVCGVAPFPGGTVGMRRAEHNLRIRGADERGGCGGKTKTTCTLPMGVAWGAIF